MEVKEIHRVNDARIDELEAAMIQGELIDCKVDHLFSPGLYTRTIFMPAGALITSRVHNTTHPILISQGLAFVSIDGGEWEAIQAPYLSVTKPGTRRILYIEDDCIWSTFHPLPYITGDENDFDETDKNDFVKRIEDDILYPYENKILGTLKNNKIVKTLNDGK